MTQAMPPALCALVIFPIGSHIYAKTCLNDNPTINASYVAGMAVMHHHAQFSLVVGGSSHELFAWTGLEP
jgi:hypothetical protein